MSSPGALEAKRPHIISLFNPSDYSTAPMSCDLIDLSVDQMKAHAACHFGLPVSGIDLVHNGNPLTTGKAIDVGIGNGAVVVVQAKGIPALGMALPNVTPVPPNMMYQMALNQFASMSPPLPVNPAMLAAGPPPPCLPQLDPRSGSAGSDASQGVSSFASSPPPTVSIPVSTEFGTYAVTSDGSRALLTALQSLTDPSETIDQLLPIICPQFDSLAVSHHASRVLIGIVNLSNKQQLLTIVTHACRDIAVLCDSNSGSEVMVSLVNATRADPAFKNEEGTPLVVEAIAGSMAAVATSVNGRKVLIAVLQKVAPDVSLVYEAACVALVALSTDQCGCITMQRMYDNAPPATRTRLQGQVLLHLDQLLTDPYGNYVVQHVVKDDEEFCAVVAGRVGERLVDFAVNKFSSNVIEKCMQAGADGVKLALMEEILKEDTLRFLMVDAYGNYVVQSLVSHAPAAVMERLRVAILPLVGGSPYGYRIETKLQKRLRRPNTTTPRRAAHSESARFPLQNLVQAPQPAPFAKPIPRSAMPEFSTPEM